MPPAEPAPIEPRPADPAFPLTRDDFNLSDLLSRASEAWSRDLGAWVLAMLLYWIIGLGIPMVLGGIWGVFGALQGGDAQPSATFAAVDVVVQVVVQVFQLVLTAIFTLGMWAMALRGLHGEQVRVGVLFSQMSKIWKYIAQTIVIGLAAVLIIAPVLLIVFLAFVGPVDRSTPMQEIFESAGQPLGIAGLVLAPLYVYITAGIAFIQTELAFNDDAGPVDAILYSWRIARGKRWRIIGVGLLAILIWVGSAMLCGIGLLFGGPFVILLVGALYLALRTGADVPPSNTATTLGRRY
jgi:hypothetical protein